MTNDMTNILIGNTPLHRQTKPPTGEYVELLGETYYRIAHYDQMPPFFMSLVSSADHWLFIASSGGLTAGRINAESALFPYETEDKIAAHGELTGSKTIIRVARSDGTHLWEPFSNRYRGVYQCQWRLYKNIPGDKLIFEEINHDLSLAHRTAWRTGDRFGFIRTCWLSNNGAEACQIDLLDGLQNLLPYGATVALQTTMSNLLNAYKRNEGDPVSGLGVFALSATLTDRAEPSESLQATVAWQVGLDDARYLLCSDQLDGFRYGRSLTPEDDIRGQAGAYLVNSRFTLTPGEQKKWHVVADVNQDSAAVTRLARFLKQDQIVIEEQIEADISQGTTDLVRYVAAADGLQQSAQEKTVVHHFANVLFNIMRGGIFAAGYEVEKNDLLDFMKVRNRAVLYEHASWFADLPPQMPIHELYARATESGVPDLIRLCYEYLPLTFSRRHGDPSRPWNVFSINLKNEDGSARLDYQGNWRDIFQNWEPLLLSFPAYTEGAIAKFLNATTADGYNPYRVTRAGIEWEVPEPDNPWSNIGYWNDHQIIYLQKLLEIAEKVQPGSLRALWNRPIFSYANVPYRIRPYGEMLADWHDTITFDWAGEEAGRIAVAALGTDGRLLLDAGGDVRHVTMMEKLLVLLLAKLTNLVPEGGIWMNTQRPEWNDANNALAGKGLSVVTVAYLRRFVAFWQALLATAEEGPFVVNTAVAALLAHVLRILVDYGSYLETGFDDRARKAMMGDLGAAATDYRTVIYEDGLPQTQVELSRKDLGDLLSLAQAFIEHTLLANRRPDDLFHAYNVLHLNDEGAGVENLDLMLEGQVAVLSSGLLAPSEAQTLLQSLRDSDLYRADQHSYMLYPNRKLAGFRHKNNVTADQVTGSKLVAALSAAGDGRLLIRDEAGVYHFNGRLRNAGDVAEVLKQLADEPAYSELLSAEYDFLLDLFESTFNHRAFTGRSGTFFAYEGLGSIYWHMVSKLLLAAQECYLQAVDQGADHALTSSLAEAYYDIRQGIGFNKSPAEYGAFPTDPYSHTPMGGGARQPGMTGQVKEEIVTRMGELGVSIRQGTLCFKPLLLRTDEFLDEASDFSYVDTEGKRRILPLPPASLAFTFCQTPIVYMRGERAKIELQLAEGRAVTMDGNCLDLTTSRHIIDRDGQVKMLRVTVQI